jgi:hypothetical protein
MVFWESDIAKPPVEKNQSQQKCKSYAPEKSKLKQIGYKGIYGYSRPIALATIALQLCMQTQNPTATKP